MAEHYCYPFTRKSLGDYYEMTWRCAKCGYCRNFLPSDTEHERFGRQCPCGDHFKFESYFASGRSEIVRRIIEGRQGLTDRLRHILYTCTTCGACEEWCQATQWRYPLRLEMATRKHFFEQGGELLPGHKQLVKNITKNFNRLNRNNRDRLGWFEQAGFEKQTGGDMVYFVGCRSSFNRTEIARSTYRVLTETLGLKVSFLEEERCCGRPLLDIGDERSAVELMKHNVEQVRLSGARTVVFSCAEGFSTFQDLEAFGIKKEFECVHLSQLLAAGLDEGKLSFKSKKARTAFHDPCYLGRHQGVYEPPRSILSAVPDLELVETPRNRKNTWCCGAGGGVPEAFEDHARWVAAEKFEEVRFVDADLLVTACPGCKESLWGLARANQIEILDLAELVDELAVK